MPKLLNENMTTASVGNFQFSATKTAALGASEYTLVSIGLDITGSVSGYETQIRDCLVAAVEACGKSAKADNLLVRVFMFATHLPNGGIEEIHGFKPLAEINPADYPQLVTGGATNLYDAAYAEVGASHAYAKQLRADEFPNNIINILITDGEDNRSTMSRAAVKKAIDDTIHSEDTESCLNILIGINDGSCRTYLEKFAQEGGFDQYVPAGDVTPAKLAKLAAFIAQSISSQSQSLGTGGPSKPIAATI